jgi:hypothetical protein
MKEKQVSNFAMGCRLALMIAVMAVNGVQAVAQAHSPGKLAKHVLNATYYDAGSSGAVASCNTSGCLATANIFTESVSCPGVAGAKCTYEVSIAATTGGMSGTGLYQFLIDGKRPTGGGTDQNGFWSFGEGQNGGGFSGSSAYTVTSQVKNTSVNQSHSIVVNLGCDNGNPGCTVGSGNASLTVRVLTP